MKEIGGFLARFKNLQAPERSVRAAVVQAVRELIGVELVDTSITIQGESRVRLSGVASVVKAAIFEQKDAVLSRVNNILGKEQIRELL